MALILSGKEASINIKSQLKEKFASLNKKTCLAIIHFNYPSSISYLKGRKKICEEMNVDVLEYVMSPLVSKEEIISLIENLNANEMVNGIMIDRPLPKHLIENEILNKIDPNKDVDGYTTINLGRLIKNEQCFYSCTPYAALRLLKYYNIDVARKNVLVIGRSINVGKPLALMLLNNNATVTVAHSLTANLSNLTKQADIIFLAVGKANFLHSYDVRKETIIVDIGINFDENNKLVGDASKDIYEFSNCYSPVPGGVGVLTNVVLMENLYKACQNKYER